MENDFELVLCSVPDRKGLVAEIWYRTEMLAELAQESGEVTIQFYPSKAEPIALDLFVSILGTAKERLLK